MVNLVEPVGEFTVGIKFSGMVVGKAVRVGQDVKMVVCVCVKMA